MKLKTNQNFTKSPRTKIKNKIKKWTKSKEKINWEVDLKIQRVRQENQWKERKAGGKNGLLLQNQIFVDDTWFSGSDRALRWIQNHSGSRCLAIGRCQTHHLKMMMNMHKLTHASRMSSIFFNYLLYNKV
jgi:hypothetical protein